MQLNRPRSPSFPTCDLRAPRRPSLPLTRITYRLRRPGNFQNGPSNGEARSSRPPPRLPFSRFFVPHQSVESESDALSPDSGPSFQLRVVKRREPEAGPLRRLSHPLPKRSSALSGIPLPPLERLPRGFGDSTSTVPPRPRRRRNRKKRRRRSRRTRKRTLRRSTTTHFASPSILGNKKITNLKHEPYPVHSEEGTANELLYPSATTFLVPLRVNIPAAAKQIRLAAGVGLPPVDPGRRFLFNLLRLLSTLWHSSSNSPRSPTPASLNEESELAEAERVLSELEVHHLREQAFVVPLSGELSHNRIECRPHVLDSPDMTILYSDNVRLRREVSHFHLTEGRGSLESTRLGPAVLSLKSQLRDLKLINVALRNSPMTRDSVIEMKRFRSLPVRRSQLESHSMECSMRRFILNNLRIGLIYEHLKEFNKAIEAYDTILTIAQRTKLIPVFHSAILNIVGCCFMTLFIQLRLELEEEEEEEGEKNQQKRKKRQLMKKYFETGLYFHQQHYEMADPDGKAIALTNQAILYLLTIRGNEIEDDNGNGNGLTDENDSSDSIIKAKKLLERALRIGKSPMVKVVTISNLILCHILLRNLICASKLLSSIFLAGGRGDDEEEEQNFVESSIERCAHDCVCELLAGQVSMLRGNLKKACWWYGRAVQIVTVTKPFHPLLMLARTCFAKARVDQEMEVHRGDALRRMVDRRRLMRLRRSQEQDDD